MRLKRIFLETRRSRSDCDDSRREPRVSSRMRWSPCGSAICVVAAHGLPLKFCRFAATTRPVCGTSTDPMTLNMCGRSFGSRPRALVRSLGSRPKFCDKRRNRRDGAGLRAAGSRSAGHLQPVHSRVCVRAKGLPPVGATLVDRHHQAVVGQRVSVRVRQQEAPIGGGVDEHVRPAGLWPSGNVRVSSR